MTDLLVHVTTESGTVINTTESHPFYVENKGWVAAINLENGDILHTKEGQIEIVTDVVVKKQEKPVKVYNLTIEDYHTYYVSEYSVLVHNDGCGNINLDEKPEVNSSKLRNFINSLYKGQGNPNQIGNGTTMDSIRYEVETGNPVEGKFHSQKGKEFVNGIKKLIDNNLLDEHDKEIALAVINDILNALSGK